MKKYVSITVICLFFVSMIQGCGLPNQPYVKKDSVAELQPLKVVRYETSDFRTYRTGNMITSIVVSGVILGAIGAGIGYAVHHSISKESDDPTRPDFGRLVMDKFIERSKNEIPNWPNMTVEEKTIKEPLTDNLYAVLEFQVDDIRVELNSSVLMIDTIITMKNKEKNIIWQKGYSYDSIYFNRINTMDALKADNYKLLKNEYAFAADKTVTDFIMHFKNSLSPQKTN